MDISKSILLKSSMNVSTLVHEAFKATEVEYFTFKRLYKDGTHIALSNYPKWMETYYADYYHISHFNRTPCKYMPGMLLWNTLENQEVFSIVREHFNMDNGITLVKQLANYCEITYFASARGNHQVLNYYLNNLDYLKKFTLSFKEKLSDTLKLAERIDKKLLPRCLGYNPDKEDNNKVSSHNSKLSIHRYTLDPHLKIHFTKKELFCLKELLSGKTAKHASAQLGIGFRTYEWHISEIKTKLNVHTKKELINALDKIGALEDLKYLEL